MTYAIVPAGGHGARMGSRRPKQYLRLGQAPILVATLIAWLGSTEASNVNGAVVTADGGWMS